MKYSLVLVLILGSVAGQPAPAPAKAAPAKAAPKAEVKKSGPLVIPAGAVEVEPNVFKFTDKTGKVSYFRQSPFGVTHYEPPVKDALAKAAPVPPAKPATPNAPTGEMQAQQQGDSIKFTRQGPFGLYTWVRKMSEMTEEEKAVFDRTKPNSESAKSQSASPKKEQ